MSFEQNRLRHFCYVLLLPLGFVFPYLLGAYDWFEEKTIFWSLALLSYVTAVAMMLSFKK